MHEAAKSKIKHSERVRKTLQKEKNDDTCIKKKTNITLVGVKKVKYSKSIIYINRKKQC